VGFAPVTKVCAQEGLAASVASWLGNFGLLHDFYHTAIELLPGVCLAKADLNGEG